MAKPILYGLKLYLNGAMKSIDFTVQCVEIQIMLDGTIEVSMLPNIYLFQGCQGRYPANEVKANDFQSLNLCFEAIMKGQPLSLCFKAVKKGELLKSRRSRRTLLSTFKPLFHGCQDWFTAPGGQGERLLSTSKPLFQDCQERFPTQGDQGEQLLPTSLPKDKNNK